MKIFSWIAIPFNLLWSSAMIYLFFRDDFYNEIWYWALIILSYVFMTLIILYHFRIFERFVPWDNDFEKWEVKGLLTFIFLIPFFFAIGWIGLMMNKSFWNKKTQEDTNENVDLKE